MKHLEFRRKYLDLLISGKKRSTIRKRAYVIPGETVFVHCGGMIIGKAKITSVRKISLENIDDKIAEMDGFSSIHELLDEINSYYCNSDLYLIEFELEKFCKPVTPHEMYYEGENLMEIARRALKSSALTQEEKEIIDLFLKTGSIRKTALKLGGISKRGLVRKVMRKAFRVVRELEHK